MIRPVALAGAHMECRLLKETIPVLTDLLAFEMVHEAPGSVTLKHPNTDWSLTVHEGGADAPAKKMQNHFGVRVATKREVDAAHDYLTGRREEYGLPEIGRPAFSHGSYSLYFLEPGTNGWEIECYEDALRKETGAVWVGGVRTPHWETTLPPERFPGRGYIPQAFTHGTLASADITASARFYAEALGLEVVRARQQVVYIKHPETKSYIVSVVRGEPPAGHSPSFRFSLEMESSEALAEAYLWLRSSGEALGMTELGEIQNNGKLASFLLRDPDKNWWELFTG